MDGGGFSSSGDLQTDFNEHILEVLKYEGVQSEKSVVKSELVDKANRHENKGKLHHVN